MNERERIGKRIRELRMQKGLSQLQLAELVGLRQPHIARIELGTYATGIDILSKVANALDCDLEVIERNKKKYFVDN
ncbi:hypothetical protein SAMD00024442_6_41 [Candidatus Symbiothrix dinenymphae]|nr:hypothetical protein SAMD00024442_6_41 [Candidatus Symbiothrix dinenymphae]